MPNDSRNLEVYDLNAGQWSALGVNLPMAYPQWSQDGQMIYFQGRPRGQPVAIFKVRLSDHRIDQVASPEHFRRANTWMGIAPDNSPMLLENVGKQDIYPFDVKLR
jgi:hypothetical protein